jgi:hypothetical protein
MITFDVSPVVPRTGPLALKSASEVMSALPSTKPDTLAGYGARAERLRRGEVHPFVDSAIIAFSAHYPLAFGPDEIWALISAGVARHVNANAEALRSRLVSHQGQLALSVERHDFVRHGPNPWDELVSGFVDEIGEHVGLLREVMTAQYSTTGPIERAVFGITLMNAVQSYFSFLCNTFCGIPRITLLGEAEDWRQLRERSRIFLEYDLGWWLSVLDPVLGKLVDTAEGRVDQEFWRAFVKYEDMSGGPNVPGWINVFFPYVGSNADEPRRNTYLERGLEGLCAPSFHGHSTKAFGSGLASVPVQWNCFGEQVELQFTGGFVGMSQDASGAIRPELGWVVRECVGEGG